MGLAPGVLAIFTLMFALAEMTSAIQTPLGHAKAISAWFDRRRGLALGIAMSGVGLGAFVVPQLAEPLIEQVGWRGAYVSLRLLSFAIAFPAVALWIREPPKRRRTRRRRRSRDAFRAYGARGREHGTPGSSLTSRGPTSRR